MRQIGATETRQMTLNGLFEAVCTRHADRIALSLEGESMTYAVLYAQALRIAAGLQQRGVGRGHVVAILLERSFAMVAAMLGVTMAGAAYLPLDPTFPAARIRETLEDARPLCAISAGALLESLETMPVDAVAFEQPAACAVAASPVASEPDDLAYIIYTSGSTGRPKGVMVTHRNLTRLFSSTEAWFHFNEHDVWTLFHSFAFDFSVWEMWGSLLHGGRLVIVPYMVSRSPENLLRLLVAEQVTVLNQTPSAFSVLSRAALAANTSVLALRLIIFGGEALSPRSLTAWVERFGDDRPALINMYGITETTVHVTYRRMRLDDAQHETESVLGEPIPDLAIDLLDEALRPVAPGEIGEMYIAGAGVARGYLNHAELTAERFLPDPLRGGEARSYRSGDLARRRADGELIYLGRTDRQVKINGFRIELGEVEAALVNCPMVRESCVIVVNDVTAGLRLAAYFVPHERHPADTRAISAWLAERLPAHMRPALYYPLSALPMTVNGKLDRAALAALTPVTSPPISPAGTLMERTVAQLWCRVLCMGAVGLDDNFFDVGGTSLFLIAVRTGLQEQLHRELPVTWFFEHTTVRSLAARLQQREEKRDASQPAADERARRQRASFARMRPQPARPNGSVAS